MGSASETFEIIAQWCEETFGPATAERIATRAAEEMDELLADPSKVEEAADIVIILSRHPTLWAEVERKMAINRKRQWQLMGDGSGYHIPAPKAASPIDEAKSEVEAPSPTPARHEEGSRGNAPAGWVLVPREPTQAMWAAYRNADAGDIHFHRAYRAMLSAAPTPDANSGGEALGGWQPIDTAPMGTEVEVRAGFMTFRAKLVPEAGMTENEHVCDQWQATREGEHPPCWSDGACWSSNVDHCPSMQPEAWRPLSAAPHPSQDTGGDDA